MKKILAFTLVLCMLFALCAVSASAVTPSAQEDAVLEAFQKYCTEKLGEGSLASVTIYDRFVWGDITYFTGGSWLEPGDEETYDVIGNYCVHSNNYQYPYTIGVYVYKDSVVYSLSDAYDASVIEEAYLASELEFITIHKAGEDVSLTHRCMDAFAQYRDVDFDKNTYIECDVYGETEDAVIFRAYVSNKDEMMACVCSQQRIGGYIFEYGYVIGPEDNPTGLYVLTDGVVYPAVKAYEEGKVSIDDLVHIVGAEEDPYDIEAKVVEKMGYSAKDSSPDEWEPYPYPYLYRELYAHYEYPSSFSAADPDYVLVYAARGPGEPAAPADRIGDYAIGSYEWCDNYRHGLYVYLPSTGALYDLRSAVEDAVDIAGISEVFLHIGRRGGIIGDTDKDGKITVKDATYIQKIIAGVEVQNPYAYYDNVVDLIRDFDRNDIVNIKDATAIQKAVAGLP